MNSGLWPRAGLVARKLQEMIERIKNREDITSLISRSPTLNSDTQNRTQSTNFKRKNTGPWPLDSNYGNKTRSKFLKTFAQGFNSPSSDSILSNKNRAVANRFGSGGGSRVGAAASNVITKYSPVRTSRSDAKSAQGLRQGIILKQETNQQQKKEGQNQTNPFELQEVLIKQDKHQRDHDEDDGTQRHQHMNQNENQINTDLLSNNQVIIGEQSTQAASRPVTPVDINVIQSEQQELYLFAALQDAKIPSSSVDRDEQIKSNQPKQLPKVYVTDDQEQNNDNNTRNLAWNQQLLSNPMDQNQQFRGSYLSDIGSEVSENSSVPNLHIQQSDQQPLFYFGEGSQMTGIVSQEQHQQHKQEDNERQKSQSSKRKKSKSSHSGSSNESDYSNGSIPSSVEVKVDESPDQGILFVNCENVDLKTTKHQTANVSSDSKSQKKAQQSGGQESKKQEEQDDDYGDDTFEKSADISRNKIEQQQQEQFDQDQYEDGVNQFMDQRKEHEI